MFHAVVQRGFLRDVEKYNIYFAYNSLLFWQRKNYKIV